MFHLRVEIQPAQVVLIELIFREGWVNRAPRCTGSRSTRSHASAAEDERLVLPVRLGGWMSASGDRPALQRRPIILLLAALSINTSEQAAVRSSLGSSATAMATGARRGRERGRRSRPVVEEGPAWAHAVDEVIADLSLLAPRVWHGSRQSAV